MKIVILGATLLLSGFSFANAPELICKNTSYDSGRSKCMQIINSGYISPEAVRVCANASFDRGKTDCAEAALNKDYRPVEADICLSRSFDSGKTKCMRNAGYRLSQRDVDYMMQERRMLAHDDRREDRRIRGMDPMRVCQNLSFDRRIGECMRVVNSGFIDQDAAEVCNRASYDSGKVNCLSASLHKEYTDLQAKVCNGASFDRGRTDCMKNSGIRLMGLEREVIVPPKTRPTPRPRRTTPRRVRVDYDVYEYQACYERPKSRVVVTTDRNQERRGRRRILGGAIGAVGGQVIGGIIGGRTGDVIGDVISVAGLGLAAYGMMEVADSRDVIMVDNGYDCRSMYRTDTRVYTHYRRGYRCETRRYYSTRWNGTHEYYETTCRGKKFITFSKHRDIWGY